MADRFSDDKLLKFYNEFKQHIKDYDATMIRCGHRFNDVCGLLEKNNELLSGIDVQQLKIEFEKSKTENEERWGQCIDNINKNANMILENIDTNKRIADSLARLENDTKGVVNLFDDFKGTARIGMAARKIVLTLAGTSAAVASIYYYIKHLLDKLAN